MKKFLKYFLVFAGFALLFASCEEEEKLYTGVQVGFESASGSLMIPVDVTTTYEGTFRVALIAEPQSNDITVSFDVAEASTAVEGTHFSMDTKTVTIPAGENFGEFDITALDSGFEFGGEFKNLVLEITDASIDIASNFSVFTLTISKESFIDTYSGTFEAYEFSPNDLENPIYGPYNVACSPIAGTNSITLNPMYDWATDDIIVQFDPSDNSILVERQVFNPGVGAGLAVEGTGSFDLETETFEIDANIYNGDALFDVTHIKYSKPSKKSLNINKTRSKSEIHDLD